MNKETCYKIIKDTLQNGFDKERFIFFIKNLLNEIDESKAFHAHGYLKHQFKQVTGIIKTYERIGTYADPEEKKIDILIVYLQKEKSIDRARTALRNFVADYLKQRNQKDAALVAFVSPNFDDWRFSLIKMDYKFEEGKNGKIKIKEEFTSARRWSFLVGAKENCHTAQSRLAPLIEDDSLNPNLHQLEEAFNIEKVTKEFFERYRFLFNELTDALTSIFDNEVDVKTDFLNKNINIPDFSKKLLGQIVFLYFLQKKGWFGVPMDKNGGDGDKKFLRTLFEESKSKSKNYFNEYLEPLFYEALAKERDDDFYSRFECRIPFLNGGLFDPIGEYDWVKTRINLPNEIFSNNRPTREGDIGDGILDIFDRYNFTVKEDEPLEKEVAIDPEMLGKVFENLLEVRDRKSQGTYYTPREIVHYMCEQSLINFLATETNTDQEILNRLMNFDQFMAQKMAKEKRVKALAMWEGEVKNIENALNNIRVIDPACGSGAFLVGVMQDIVKLRKILRLFFKTNNLTDYKLKLTIIQNNLYGVDIDPSAVEIAKLRLWLSLVVDEEDIKQIKPLPNLDYKIMQGNSLIELLSPELLAKNTDADRSRIIDKLKTAKQEFLGLTTLKQKKEKREEINGLIREIINYDSEQKRRSLWDKLKQQKAKQKLFKESAENLDFSDVEKKEIQKTSQELEKVQSLSSTEHFEWHINFNEVFEEKGGFDIVIGNPPYLSAIQDSKNEVVPRETYRQKYALLRGAFDIYIIFLIKGIEITHKRGSFSWIVPNKLLVAGYAKDVLDFLKENGLYMVISISFIKVFEASVYPILIFGDKSTKAFNEYEIDSLEKLATGELKRKTDFFREYTSFNTAEIKVASGATGFQAAQLVNYISDIPSENKIPFIVSGSIDPYRVNVENVRYMGRLYSKAFIKKGTGIADSKWNFWKKEKIVIAGMTKRIEATFVSSSLALGVGVYAIYDYGGYHPKFLLAILNSKFMTSYLNHKFKEKHLAGGYLAINKSTIEKLPIVPAAKDDQKPFIGIVDKILAITKSGDYLENPEKQTKVKEYEKQIDQMVYKLYELTPEEIKIVENKTESRLFCRSPF